jgi:hypothetical protein
MTESNATDPKPILLDVPRFEQPDDVTCGPTCLAQVYRFFGSERTLTDVIRETRRNADGGTLAVYLGISALKNGFRATIYPYSLQVFDPTWRELGISSTIEKLCKRKELMRSPKLRQAIGAYITYLQEGGRLRFDELTRDLLVGLLQGGQPILTGLSATYLYRTPREYNNQYDDICGDPAGHFVVICGYYPKSDKFVIRDPSSHSPFSRSGKYSVPAERLIPAILLGEVTYDAVLLVLSPR